MECGCCHKFLVTQEEGKWGCWYCASDNHTKWRCECAVTSITNIDIKFLGGLPQELLVHVFSWSLLPAVVCALTTNKSSFQYFFKNYFANDRFVAEPFKWSRLKRNIDEFTEDEKLDPVNDSLMLKVARMCPRLRVLDLQACHLVTDLGLNSISEICHDLQEINLRSCTSVTDQSIKQLVTRCSLRRINLRGCFRLTDESIECMALHCPCLSKLDLFYCHEITDRSLKALAFAKPKCVCFPFIESKDKAIPKLETPLGKQHHLISLDLGHCDEITAEGVHDVLLKHPHLESVSLTQCDQLSDSAILPLAGCLSLTYLNLSGCPWLSTSAISEVCSRCILLERLDLGGCVGVGDECLETIAPKLEQLQSFSVAECPNITNVGISALAQCKNLHTLYATACDHLTDVAVLALTSQNLSLRTLSLNFCSKLTDQSLLALRKCSKTLQNLHVGQTQASDVGLMHLLSVCSQMKEIDIHNCRVSDLTLLAIGASCFLLENLDVRGCDISNMSLKALLTCSRLQNLYVTGCFRLTYDAFRPLVAKFGDEFQIHAHMSTQF